MSIEFEISVTKAIISFFLDFVLGRYFKFFLIEQINKEKTVVNIPIFIANVINLK